MKYRSPLARVRGLGSAKGGTQHWWAQRLTALALIPLGVWLVASVVSMAGADHAAFVAWMRSPVTTILWLAAIVALFHHAQLGVQVVLEDYVHGEWLKVGSIALGKLLAVLLAMTCMFAVLRISLGS